MRRANAISVKVKAPSRGLVTRWPSDTADLLSPSDLKRVCVEAQNVRFEDGVIAAAPGYERVGLTSLFTGLRSHWKFNETAGTRYDSQGTNHLTPTSASYAAGKIGNAVTFTGSASYASATVSSSLGLDNNDFTIAGWFKISAYPTVGNSFTVFEFSASGASFIRLGVRNTGVGTRPFVDVRQVNGSGSVGTSQLTPATNVLTGTWRFLRFYFNRVTGVFTLKIDETTSAASASGLAPAFSTSGASVYFGQSASGSNSWNGAADSFSVWDRQLSAGEITSLYNAGSGLDYPFAFVAEPVFRIHQANIIATDPTPLFVCTGDKIYTGVRSFSSSPREFYLTLTQVFSGATATLPRPWKVVDFFDKVVFAQQSVEAQYWKSATGVLPLPGLPDDSTYDGVESFLGHLLLWKNENIIWSDLNDFSTWIPVAETVASLRLTLSAAADQVATGATTAWIPVTEITTGLTVGQYVRVVVGTGYNTYLVNAVSPSAGLTATLVAGGTQTITGSATTKVFVTAAKLWAAGQRVVSSVDTTKVLTVAAVSPDSLASYSLSDDSAGLPAVGTTFDVLLTDIKTALEVGDFISLGAAALPSLDVCEITAISTDTTSAKTKLTIKQKNLGSAIKGLAGVYETGTAVVKQPWVSLTKADAGNISATASSTLAERYAVKLTLQDLTGVTPVVAGGELLANSVITTLDANEAGAVVNVGADINGPVYQIVSLGEYAFVLKQWSIQSIQYVGRQSGTFFARTEVNGEGLIGRNSFVKFGNGRLVFLGNRELYSYRGGSEPTPVAVQYTRQLFSELDRSKVDEIILHHKETRNEVWVIYPSNNSTVRVMVWNYVEDTVTIDNYSAALQKLTAAATVDWSIDSAWESLPADLTWTLEGQQEDRDWTDFGTDGVQRVTLLASQEASGFAVLLHGYRFSRDGAGYEASFETTDFDFDDDTVMKYPELVTINLQLRGEPDVTDRTLYVQVGTKNSLDGELVWSDAKTVNVKGNAPPPIKVNPRVRGGRFVRLRMYSLDPDTAWRVSRYEIYARAGGTY